MVAKNSGVRVDFAAQCELAVEKYAVTHGFCLTTVGPHLTPERSSSKAFSPEDIRRFSSPRGHSPKPRPSVLRRILRLRHTFAALQPPTANKKIAEPLCIKRRGSGQLFCESRFGSDSQAFLSNASVQCRDNKPFAEQAPLLWPMPVLRRTIVAILTAANRL